MKPLRTVAVLQLGSGVVLLLLIVTLSSAIANAQTVSLGDAVDNTSLTWATGGNANWFGQTAVYYYDGDAAQNGNITSGQSSWIQTTITGPGILSFYWKVSSSFAWTDLKFYIDGVEKASCWADTAWELKTYAISSGSHILKWDYAPFVQSGADAGFLDKVVFIPGPVIMVNRPNGGETWYRRNFGTITWTSTEDVGANVKIELLKGSSSVKTISTSTANDGGYGWFIPTTIIPGSDYRIRVSSATNASVYDDSDGNFSILESSWGPLPSVFGGALILSTTNSYAQADDHPELDVGDEPGESLTIEGWFYDLGSYRSGNIVYKSKAYGLNAWRYWSFSQTYGCIGFNLTSPAGQQSATSHCEWPPYSSGWHHAAVVFDKGTGQVQLYLDGRALLDNPSTWTAINNSTEPLQVGSGLGGVVDEVRISSVARYSGTTYTVPTSPFTCDANTRALWHFDEYEGATVFHDACGIDNVLVGYNGAHTEGLPGYRLYLPLILK